LTVAYVFKGWRWKASEEYDFSLWHENVMHLTDRDEETARRKVRYCGAAVFRSCSRDKGDSSDDQKRQSPARSPHDKSRPRYEHETQKRCLNKHTQRRHPTPLPMTALSGLCNLLRLSSDRNRDTITRLRFFLPNLSLLTRFSYVVASCPWREGVWSGACVSGTLRCVKRWCFGCLRG